jgi:hypothetical protein
MASRLDATVSLPCRLARLERAVYPLDSIKQNNSTPASLLAGEGVPLVSQSITMLQAKLIHLPDKLARVWVSQPPRLAEKLSFLPDKPAGDSLLGGKPATHFPFEPGARLERE